MPAKRLRQRRAPPARALTESGSGSDSDNEGEGRKGHGGASEDARAGGEAKEEKAGEVAEAAEAAAPPQRSHAVVVQPTAWPGGVAPWSEKRRVRKRVRSDLSALKAAGYTTGCSVIMLGITLQYVVGCCRCVWM